MSDVAAGWYDDGAGRKRYWDGAAWTEHFAPARAEISAAEREAILNAQVARFSLQGWTVSSQTVGQAVLQRKARIGWFWNIILTLLTFGLWLIVVIVRVVNRRIETKIIRVNEFGELY